MAKSLPQHPSLEQLRKQAKELLKGFQNCDDESLRRLLASHPAFANASEAQVATNELTLRDAQLIVAREYSFENWADLKEYLAWDICVKEQDVDAMRDRLQENPRRVRQQVRTFRGDGTYWSMEPVHFSNNNAMMLKLLVEYGAELNVPGEPPIDGDSAPEFIDFAADMGVDLDNQYYNGSVLTQAVGSGNIETLRRMLLRGANPNSRCEGPGVPKWEYETGGATALHIAACCSDSVRRGDHYKPDLDVNKHTEMVRILIDAGADVNARTDVGGDSDMGLIYQGETPLHFAAACGDEAMIQMLLDHGADTTARTATGETPLDYASRYQRPDTIQRLVAPPEGD